MRGGPVSAARIVVVDDHRLVREGVRVILAAEQDLTVVAEGGSHEAVALAARFQPDIMLLDAQHLSMSPVTAIIQVTRVSPRTRVVVLSVHADNTLIRSLANAGAAAFLTKCIGARELCSELRLVAEGSRSFSVRLPHEAIPPPGAERSGSAALTDRELEVLRLVSVAMTNSEIAAKLFLSEATVKRHLTNIFAKLATRSRLEAVNRAEALGLLDRQALEWRQCAY